MPTSNSAADADIELTHEEFADAEFDSRYRYERFKGRLIVTPRHGFEYHLTIEPFRNYLGAYELAHPEIIEHVFQEAWTSIDEDTDRLPDIAVYLRSQNEPSKLPDRVPELIFEIVSPGRANCRRDYDEKRDEYERVGVLEYVIVDRFNHEVTVLQLVDDHYHEETLKPRDTYRTPLLPGLEIPL